MFDLTTIQKNKFKIAAGIFLVLVLIFINLAILGKIQSKSKKTSEQPQSPKIPTIYQNPAQKQPKRFDFSTLNQIAYPQNLPVYTAQKNQIDLSKAQAIAAKFSFTGEPSKVINSTADGTQFSWFDKNRILAISQTTIRFDDQTQNSSNSLAEEDLKNKASDFINSLPLIGSGLVLNDKKTAYYAYSNSKLISASSFADSQYVQFSFDRNLSNNPIYNSALNPSYLTISIKKDGNINQLYTKIFSDFTANGQYPLKTLDEAKKEIENGQGKIVNTFMPDKNGQALQLYQLQPNDISIAKFNNVALAYFLPVSTSENIVPIFVFTGDFLTYSNQTGKIVLYLPAIQTSQP